MDVAISKLLEGLTRGHFLVLPTNNYEHIFYFIFFHYHIQIPSPTLFLNQRSTLFVFILTLFYGLLVVLIWIFFKNNIPFYTFIFMF